MIFNPGIMAATGAAGAVTGSYTGNGDKQKTLGLGFEPAAILILSSIDSGGNVYLMVAVNGASNGLGITSSSTYKHSTPPVSFIITLPSLKPNTRKERLWRSI